MTENLQFILKQVFYYVSAFINSKKVDGNQISVEIENAVKQKLNNLSDKDIFRKDLKDRIIEIAKNTTIDCLWVPYIEHFPYQDENSDRDFNTLGYFEFNVDHYKDKPSEKEKLTPMLLQQIPYLVLGVLAELSKKEEYKVIYLDLESPLYMFATSNGCKPANIQWTSENIEKYKKEISYWTVIYSGQWEDYSDDLYDRRVQSNLSNRLSELHFIHRNSGFIYMAEENYENFFESYMIKYVIEPTPKMRAVQFSLRSINESLDLLFLKTQTGVFENLDYIEEKIKNLRLLRGLIQTRLSVIYNELDYNRREHYTTVLKYLLNEFDIKGIAERINEKFETIYEAIQDLYQKQNEQNQKRTEKGLNLLNLLFGAGILADLAGVIMLAFTLQEGDLPTVLLNSIIGSIITVILSVTVIYYIYTRIMMNKTNIQKAVDAIIDDNQGNIILIKRKYPPYKDYYALPGGAVEKGETLKQAVIREIKEETNLDIEIDDKVGVYDKPGRDPRGDVHSTVYKCKIIGGKDTIKSGDDSKDVIIISLKELENIKLAFDHKEMLKDAGYI
ncbi:MAG: NUDIX hydrolase [Candidatus Lokiarchaeota archaeon]|nr:NUDIX hydrolase [Candidatus Lokiarchaeota archaeon]